MKLGAAPQKACIDTGTEGPVFKDDGVRSVFNPAKQTVLEKGKYFIVGINEGGLPIESVGPADLVVEGPCSGQQWIFTCAMGFRVPKAGKNLINPWAFEWSSATAEKVPTGIRFDTMYGTITGPAEGKAVPTVLQCKQSGNVGDGTLFDLEFHGMHDRGGLP
jgi:hypothetical protein